MAKKRNSGLGSPPSKHVKKIRHLLPTLSEQAKRVVYNANRGDCAEAAAAWGDLRETLGEVRAHQGSTSEKSYSGMRALVRKPQYKFPREVVAARQALRKCFTGVGI